MINKNTIKSARDLVELNSETDEVVTRNNLDDINAQWFMELAVAKSKNSTISNMERIVAIHNSISYLNLRMTDISTRLHLIECVWDHYRDEKRSKDLTFYYIGAVLVKDFHIDIGAVMDAIAPVAIWATQDIPKKQQKKLPGFSDLLPGEVERSYRKNMPEDIRKLVDSTSRWWPTVKRVRDLVSHREHQKLVFDVMSKVKTFQIYDKAMSPQMLDAAFLLEDAHNVVNLDRYIAFIMAEINVLLDHLGLAIAKHLACDISGRSTRSYKLSYLVTELDQLCEIIE